MDEQIDLDSSGIFKSSRYSLPTIGYMIAIKPAILKIQRKLCEVNFAGLMFLLGETLIEQSFWALFFTFCLVRL